MSHALDRPQCSPLAASGQADEEELGLVGWDALAGR